MQSATNSPTVVGDLEPEAECMRLKNLRVTAVLFALLGCTLSNAFAQNGDNEPLSDLPRQFSATAFGQAVAMSGKSFGLNVYITAWTSDQQV
jgi:hypothetical protein